MDRTLRERFIAWAVVALIFGAIGYSVIVGWLLPERGDCENDWDHSGHHATCE